MTDFFFSAAEAIIQSQKRSYERSRKGGNELATISQCMKKRPNFIGYLINLQKRGLFLRTARNPPTILGSNSKIFSFREKCGLN